MFSLTIKEIPTISTSIFKQVLLSYILVLLNSAESQIELGFCLKKKKNLISINRVAKRNRNKMLQKTKKLFLHRSIARRVQEKQDIVTSRLNFLCRVGLLFHKKKIYQILCSDKKEKCLTSFRNIFLISLQNGMLLKNLATDKNAILTNQYSALKGMKELISVTATKKKMLRKKKFERKTFLFLTFHPFS